VVCLLGFDLTEPQVEAKMADLATMATRINEESTKIATRWAEVHRAEEEAVAMQNQSRAMVCAVWTCECDFCFVIFDRSFDT
jgi:hypothetical protein